MILQSSFANFQDAINAAIAANDELLIDGGGSLPSVIVNGNITVRATPGVVIVNPIGNLFTLGNGRHSFDGLHIVQGNPVSGTATPSAWFTNQTLGIEWANSFRNCSVRGGECAYYSSNGGSISNPAISTFDNCDFATSGVCVSVFSNEGPTIKELHMSRCNLSSDTKHNIYAHPHVSFDLCDVAGRKTGIGFMFMHHFSGSFPERNGMAKFVRFNRVRASSFAEMIAPANGYCELTDCSISPYTTFANPNPKVLATRCQFFNAGNGVMLQGRLVDCGGTVWSSSFGELTIEGGSYAQLSTKRGGRTHIRGATVNQIAVGEDVADSDVRIYRESKVASIYDGRKGSAKVTVYGPNVCNYVPSAVRTGLVEMVP